MNQRMAQHLDATYFGEYQALRGELVDRLTNGDLEFRLGGASLTLGALCREMGEVEYAYIESFRSFRQDFAYRHPQDGVEHDVAALRAWYADLDRELMAALDALSDEDVSQRHITRGDPSADAFSLLPPQQLDVYREALLIFYGKVSIYLRAMGKPLPGHWPAWIA
jgi:uncharacterized damage-inducible protein DinB